MGKTILGTIAGLVIGVIVVMIVESIGHMIYPPPEGVDLKDPDQLAAIMKTIPFGAKLAVLIAWGLGVFAGGVAGIKLSGGQALPATIIAALIFLSGVATMFMIPHPLWMMIATPIVTILAWYLARKLALKST